MSDIRRPQKDYEHVLMITKMLAQKMLTRLKLLAIWYLSHVGYVIVFLKCAFRWQTLPSRRYIFDRKDAGPEDADQTETISYLALEPCRLCNSIPEMCVQMADATP